MTDGPLPDYVDARKVFAQQQELSGSVDLQRLQRFRDTLAHEKGEVSVSLRFDRNPSGQRLIQGSLAASVEVICQRCLEPFQIDLADDINLALVSDEEAAGRLEADLDPWVSQDPKLVLASLVEEQLMLCMPIVNYHPEGSCLGTLSFGESPEQGASGEADRQNPFAALKSLKK